MRLVRFFVLVLVVSGLMGEGICLAEDQKDPPSTAEQPPPPPPKQDEKKPDKEPDKKDDQPVTTCVRQTNGEWRCGPC